jgi:hypothetical protein
VVQLGDKTATGIERQLACRRSNTRVRVTDRKHPSEAKIS